MFAHVTFAGDRLFRLFFLAASFVALLFVSGCVSSSSNVSTYASGAVSSASAKLVTAKKEKKAVEKDVAKAERDVKKLTRQIARDEKRLTRKRLSKKAKSRAEKRLKTNNKALKVAKRTVSRSDRLVRRATRNVSRAERKLAREKKAKIRAQNRFEAAEKRKAEALARKARKAEDDDDGRLFGFSDPAFKNVRDYKSRVDNGFSLAAIPVKRMDKRLYRQEVRYRTSHKPGTIVVDTGSRYLYLVQRGGTAMRYGIGVGRQGFSWSGTAHIGWKSKWPTWTPPEEMIARQPKLRKYSADNGGMEGGPKNPLGARALYLVKDGKDTLYRLHGTPQWKSIGTAASSGCIRLINQDVIDLHQRVPNGAKVVVL